MLKHLLSNWKQCKKSTHTTSGFNAACEGLLKEMRQEKEMKDIHIRKKEVKLSLFVDDIIIGL